MIATLHPYPASQSEVEQTGEVSQDQALVKCWLARIKTAEEKWGPDFKRMRQDMEFAAGLQWEGQTELIFGKYSVNIVLRLINHLVSTIYAKNPTVEARTRKRMYFKVWDESTQSLQEALVAAQQMIQSGMPLPPELIDLLTDIERGRAKQQLVTKVGRTLETVIQYFMDETKPDFKDQMKQLIVRVATCGVGYVKPIFCQAGYEQPISSDFGSDVEDRLGRIKALVEELQESEEDQTSAHWGTLRSLIMSVGASQALGEEEDQLAERIEFDFPPATTIIPDTRCRGLRDWIAARWVAQKYVLPLDEVNAIFGTKVEVGNDKAKEAKESTKDLVSDGLGMHEVKECPSVTLYEVHDYVTKTRFFLVDGWNEFVQAPEADPYGVRGFWKLFALTFNDIEVEEGLKVSPFPPSMVTILRHPQMEWNRTRNALRHHRIASAPKYLVRKNMVSEEDIRKIRESVEHEVLEIEGQPDQDLELVVKMLQTAKIDAAMYDNQPLEQDIMLAGGLQQANLGPAQENVTATVGAIAEQSRNDVAGSQVDSLDSLLNKLAQACGEMWLKGGSQETTIRICDEGAVLPDSPEIRREFLNEVFLNIQAASSGRPNKAMDIANFRDLAPLLLQAGINPAFLAEEGVRRLDDNLDIDRAFPLLPPGGVSGGQAVTSGSNDSPESPQSSTAEPERQQNNVRDGQPQASPGAEVAA